MKEVNTMHIIVGLLAIGMILLPFVHEMLFDDYGDHYVAAMLMIEFGMVIGIVNFVLLLVECL
jgi:hypothetical protein